MTKKGSERKPNMPLEVWEPDEKQGSEKRVETRREFMSVPERGRGQSNGKSP